MSFEMLVDAWLMDDAWQSVSKNTWLTLPQRYSTAWHEREFKASTVLITMFNFPYFRCDSPAPTLQFVAYMMLLRSQPAV